MGGMDRERDFACIFFVINVYTRTRGSKQYLIIELISMHSSNLDPRMADWRRPREVEDRDRPGDSDGRRRV